MDLFLQILLLIVGMALLIKGADFFVEGASSIAKRLRIPSLVIGLTLVSIGTSMPEFSVSLTSSINNLNDMSFGNVVGSNIFNTFVVIGVASIITPLTVSKDMHKYDIPILIGIYLLLSLFSFVISKYYIELWEAIIIFVLTFIYTAFLIIRSKNEIKEEQDKLKNSIESECSNNNNKDTKKPKSIILNIIFVIIGLAGIVFGGDLVVDNASKIAIHLGMSELLVGLTIVAIGTSLPELVTSIVAGIKGENDIAVGNAIGSSIFNVILILGLSAIIRPMPLKLGTEFDVIIMIISAVVIFVISLFFKKKINRVHGIILVLIYIGYLSYIIIRNVQEANMLIN